MPQPKFRIADLITPVKSGRTRLLLRTTLATSGPNSGISKVPDGTTWDIRDDIADRYLAAGMAVVFDPAKVLAHLMKAAGVSGATLASKHLAGLPAALGKVKITHK